MLTARPDVLDFLLTRRSRPAKTLTAPVPDHAALMPILTAALRTPDHGKLEPWRLIVLEKPALDRLADLAVKRGQAIGQDADRLEKTRRQFADADLVVVVVASPVASPKVPEGEQILSAGAVCLAVLNAALASGWGANWLTGAMATDAAFLTEGLQIAAPDFIAGFIHIGSETSAPPDRPRPDIAVKVTWISA
ncbi:MAG: nitroreductase family protein [Rhodobacterales bacterium]|jgi:nitroreductase|nr:nitroreductase [Paracoccaceae bacterium]